MAPVPSRETKMALDKMCVTQESSKWEPVDPASNKTTRFSIPKWFPTDQVKNDSFFRLFECAQIGQINHQKWSFQSLKSVMSSFHKIYFYELKVTGHSKMLYFCRVSPISTRLFCYITCIFKRPSLQLFRFKISQFVPFRRIIRCFHTKREKLWNFKSK